MKCRCADEVCIVVCTAFKDHFFQAGRRSKGVVLQNTAAGNTHGFQPGTEERLSSNEGQRRRKMDGCKICAIGKRGFCNRFQTVAENVDVLQVFTMTKTTESNHLNFFRNRDFFQTVTVGECGVPKGSYRRRNLNV